METNKGSNLMTAEIQYKIRDIKRYLSSMPELDTVKYLGEDSNQYYSIRYFYNDNPRFFLISKQIMNLKEVDEIIQKISYYIIDRMYVKNIVIKIDNELF